jgi:hypothetical protein
LYCSNGGTLFCLWHYLVEPTPPPPPPQQQQILKENVAVDAEGAEQEGQEGQEGEQQQQEQQEQRVAGEQAEEQEEHSTRTWVAAALQASRSRLLTLRADK